MQLQLPPDVSFCTITSNLCIREQNTRGKKYRNEQAVPLDVAPKRRTMMNHSEILVHGSLTFKYRSVPHPVSVSEQTRWERNVGR